MATDAGTRAEQLQRIAAAYTQAGPALELGALVADGKADPGSPIRLPLSMVTRHGLVAGATGTGKTKTLQLLAEQLSAAGVPVLVTDIKGDASGLAAAGEASPRVTARSADVGERDWAATAVPVELLVLGGDAAQGGKATGTAVRATVTSFGPTLLAKVLGLNETQESSLGLVFHAADAAGLALLDLQDLRAVLQWLVSDDGKPALEGLGGLARSTAQVILRELLTFADSGADAFFGEPEFDTSDLLRRTPDGRGVISVVELQGVQDRPALTSTFLLWLLADLFQDLPEVGDVDAPGLVFFLDEAHLLFTDASKAFLAAVTQTVRLIRSKGVGVWFVTQNPTDIPDEVLGQLGNRVQHALRAFTPDDAKALRQTVSTFPRSEVYDLTELLPALAIGEAVVTVLSPDGVPTPVAHTRLRPPRSRMAPLSAAEAQAVVAGSVIAGEYAEEVDRESAYERLLARVAPAPAAAPAAPEPPLEPAPSRGGEMAAGLFGSFARAAASTAGREIARSLFGTARRRAPARRSRRRSSGGW